jgi:hypothetical protein
MSFSPKLSSIFCLLLITNLFKILFKKTCLKISRMYHEGGDEEEKKRERERESKGRQRRETNIPHFLRKQNYALSPLLTGERERGIKKTKKRKKKKMMWHICFFFFFVNWSYFIMSLLHWALF